MTRSETEKGIRRINIHLEASDIEGRDIEAFSLKDAAILSGRESDAFLKSVDAQIETINDESLSSEQRRLKQTASELSKQPELFHYSMEKTISNDGEFVDLREVEPIVEHEGKTE